VEFQLILQEDGLLGFFRGMSPRLARKVLSAAIVWTGYEEILKAIAKRKMESGQ
jgi:solute carrier family 25, member 38